MESKRQVRIDCAEGWRRASGGGRRALPGLGKKPGGTGTACVAFIASADPFAEAGRVGDADSCWAL